MRVLCIGDIVGQSGCDFLRKNLYQFRQKNTIDFCIANGENAVKGNGITSSVAEQLLASGVDIITTGNHVFKKNEVYDYLNNSNYILRPANYPAISPGKGYTVIDKIKYSICVINLMGVIFLENVQNPFECIDKILKEVKADIIIIDFHAEATTEKLCMAHYLDGRVSAIFGTHTHVQTSDETIFPNGTGYITDVGMTGPELSVLGIKPELALRRMMTHMPVRFEHSDNPCMMSGAVFEIDERTGKAISVERINLK